MNKFFYLLIVGVTFLVFTVVFDTFPRSRVSELEKRELATFPEFTMEKLASGEFTTKVSSWFSDSEPYRDYLMALSMTFKQWIALKTGEDQVTFHAAEDEMGESEEEVVEEEDDNRNLKEYTNNINANEKAKMANAGIIIVGSGPNVRALMAYGGEAGGGMAYADVVNKYKETFGPSVNVYCMVIPTAIEYYCPESVKSRTKSQRATINNVYAHLSEDVKAVDIYSTLGEHAAEDIYLRTDHHWSPLGGFYAARKFAEVAKVPFRDLSSYERNVVHGYVGSMYGYSKDIAVKKAPEDFVYYIPLNVTYTTTYITYSTDKKYNVTSEKGPTVGEYFHKYKDGSGGAYCTFMGGDTKITKVETDTNNGRRVLILKDSFGNTIPGYLFYSFEEVHVVDYRYFTKNIKKYVKDNKITDIVFANNSFVMYSPYSAKCYNRFLTQ